MDKRERNEEIMRLRQRRLTYAQIGARVGLGERQVQRMVKESEAAHEAALRSLKQGAEKPEPRDTSYVRASVGVLRGQFVPIAVPTEWGERR